jgi:hypothetical protein
MWLGQRILVHAIFTLEFIKGREDDTMSVTCHLGCDRPSHTLRPFQHLAKQARYWFKA